jgi:hypothetical protein
MQPNIQMDAAKAWADAGRNYAEAASATWWSMASNAADLWTLPTSTMLAATEAAAARSKPKSRSWYRKPPETPLDLMMSWFDPGMASRAYPAWPMAPMSPMTSFNWFDPGRWPSSGLMGWPAMQPGGMSVNQFWLAMQLAVATAPVQQAVAEAVSSVMQPSSFAAYRSDGGHAVAHVTMAASKLMAVLVPMLFAATLYLSSLSEQQFA